MNDSKDRQVPAARLKTLALLLAGITASWQAQAQAQTQNTERLDRVEVTGSNIKRLANEGLQSVQVITAADIERQGVANAGELLDRVTTNGAGKIAESNTNTFTPGAAGASLRGLGANATLVLLNGRRVAYYGFVSTSTFVDLYSIPWSAIERVEILKEGASAIYGTDALGGVINFILKRNFQGAEVMASAGRSLTFSDMDYRSFSATAGHSGERFNVIGVFDHYQRDGVLQAARPSTYRDQTDAALAAGYTLADVGYVSQKWGAATPGFNGMANYSYTGNLWNGSKYLAYGECNRGMDKLNAAGTCVHSYSEDTSFLPSHKRSSAFGRLNWDFSASTSLFAELSLSRSNMVMDWIPTSTSQLTLNYFQPGQWGNTADKPVYFRRLFWEMGPRRRETTSDSARLVAGLKGEAAGWDWELALGGARTDSQSIGTGYLDVEEAKKRIGSMNVFGVISPADAAAISGQTNRFGDSTSLFADAKASRELFKLPAGPVMMALGADFRKDEMSDATDERTNAGLVQGGGVRRPISGERSQHAFYGELSVPVIKGLETQLALRSDHYDGFGSTVNPKLAFKWLPRRELMLRGSLATGFRAPSVPEMKGEYEYWSTDPADANQSIKVRQINAPDLGPEKSRNWNLGGAVELSPGWIAGVDVWQVRRRDEVYFPGPGTDQPLEKIDKGSEGYPIWIYKPYNAGQTRIQGADIDINGRIKLGAWGQLSLSSVSTYLDRVVWVNAKGVSQETAGEWGNPRWRNSSSLWWSRGVWGAGMSLNFRGSFKAYYQNRDDSLRVPAFTTVDMSLNYAGIKNLKLSGGLSNIGATRPPFELNDARNGFNYDDNPHGRRVWLRAAYAFN